MAFIMQSPLGTSTMPSFMPLKHVNPLIEDDILFIILKFKL